MTTAALPPVVDAETWQRELDTLRAREKAATRELDAIAAQRRRLPMVEVSAELAARLEAEIAMRAATPVKADLVNVA